MILSWRYKADFLHRRIHKIRVYHNVKEIIFGEVIFPSSHYTASTKFGSKFRKNIVSLELEEHVFVEEEKEMVFDHHGEIRQFS